MPYSTLRKWLKNLCRTVIVALAVTLAITFYYSLHKILGFSGVIFGSIIVLIMPSASHNRLLAKDNLERAWNYFIITYALLVMLIVGFFILYFWDATDD